MAEKSEEDNQANEVVGMKLINIWPEGTSIGALVQLKPAWYLIDELLERFEDGYSLSKKHEEMQEH
jgi:hypothetical protein